MNPPPLRQQLLDAESSFMLAASQGSDALRIFDNSWTALEAALESGIESGSLDEDTMHLAHHVFTRVGILAESLLTLEEELGASAIVREKDIDIIISDLCLDDDPISKDSTSPARCTNPTAPYMECACTWLIQNIHNPYPPKNVKLEIARSTSSSLKDVESWFSAARKHIGWTQLCTKRFRGKRGAILEAAAHYFSLADRLDGVASVHEADFIEIRCRAIELSEVNDMRHTSPTLLHTLSSNYHHPYPSPESSPGQSRCNSPSPACNNNRRKRRLSNASEDLQGAVLARPYKKLRSVISHSAKETAVHLPSPASSPRIGEGFSRHDTDSTCSLKRKRTSSSLDESRSAKRPAPETAPTNINTPAFAQDFISNFSWNVNNALELSDVFPAPVSIEMLPDAGTFELDCYPYSLSPSLSDLGLEQLSPPFAAELFPPATTSKTTVQVLPFHFDPPPPEFDLLEPIFQHRNPFLEPFISRQFVNQDTTCPNSDTSIVCTSMSPFDWGFPFFSDLDSQCATLSRKPMTVVECNLVDNWTQLQLCS